MPQVLEFVWRRQLAAAARRRVLRGAVPGETPPVCVGFADLVGFTAQTQQLDQAALARVVGRFESIAYDVVARHGARVVKTIGDEVMFVADDVRTGAELALELARSYREDPNLSDVRVGLATGPVLERDGDVYGHTVNLASRIVSIAYPGSVVVGPAVHQALADDGRFDFTSLRHHYLKDIGRVALWRLQRSGDSYEGAYRTAREGRSARRRVLQDRWRERDRSLRERAAGGLAGATPPEDLESLPERLSLVLRGEAPPEVVQDLVDDPTVDELDALTELVLSADIDADLQLDLLTDIGAAQALRELDREADRKAEQADDEAERRLRRIEADTARRVAEVEHEAQRKVAEAIARAEEESRKVDVEAARRFEKVVAEAHDKAERATREARARASRAAQRRRKRNR
nr:adenylate/guanylate cyclase domain-containing protein [Rhabdothermincola salaria]